MCGIALIIRKDHSGISDRIYQKYVSTLKESLLFRGPDGSNIVHVTKDICLIHTRLSINGLGDGQQPFYHHKNRKCISAVNGEIYNYPELRKYYGISQLATGSDCEVLGHGYSLMGANSFNKLDGMFAGIVADLDNKIFLVVRDSFGEKPIFIYENDQILIISSSIKSIVNSIGRASFTLSRKNLQMFLRYQFIPFGTIFNEIQEIPAGTISEFNFNGIFRSRESLRAPSNNLDLLSTLGKSVERVALSEVPIATTLSGGMDSALIHHFLSKINVQLTPYTIDNKTTSSEWLNAEKTANAYGYNSVQLSIPDDYFLDFIHSKYPLLDSPFGDITSAAYYYLCENAKSDNNKVIVFGHGLDEFFFGYKWVNEVAESCLSRSNEQTKFTNKSSKLGLFDSCPYVINTDPDFKRIPLRNNDDIVSLDDLVNEALDVKKSISNLYMRKNGLLQLDNISMHVGIEARSPFVYSQLSDLADSLFSNLSSKDKINTLQSSKLAIRNLVSEFIPQLHHTLEKKKGFSPDVTKWHQIIKSYYKENWDDTYLSSHGYVGSSCDAIESMSAPACRVLFFLDQHLTSFNFDFNLN